MILSFLNDSLFLHSNYDTLFHVCIDISNKSFVRTLRLTLDQFLLQPLASLYTPTYCGSLKHAGGLIGAGNNDAQYLRRSPRVKSGAIHIATFLALLTFTESTHSSNPLLPISPIVQAYIYQCPKKYQITI